MVLGSESLPVPEAKQRRRRKGVGLARRRASLARQLYVPVLLTCCRHDYSIVISEASCAGRLISLSPSVEFLHARTQAVSHFSHGHLGAHTPGLVFLVSPGVARD